MIDQDAVEFLLDFVDRTLDSERPSYEEYEYFYEGLENGLLSRDFFLELTEAYIQKKTHDSHEDEMKDDMRNRIRKSVADGINKEITKKINKFASNNDFEPETSTDVFVEKIFDAALSRLRKDLISNVKFRKQVTKKLGDEIKTHLKSDSPPPEYKTLIEEIKGDLIKELRHDEKYIKSLSTDLLDDIANDLF